MKPRLQKPGLYWGVLGICVGLALTSVEVQAGDPFRGQSIYNQHCVGCHGSDGVGLVAGTPSFRAPSPSLMQPDGNLQQTIEQGRGIMPGFAGILKPDQIYDVIAHLRTIF